MLFKHLLIIFFTCIINIVFFTPGILLIGYTCIFTPCDTETWVYTPPLQYGKLGIIHKTIYIPFYKCTKLWKWKKTQQK